MKYNRVKLLILSFSAIPVGLFLFLFASFPKTINIANGETQFIPSPTPLPTQWTLHEKISEAKSLLKNSAPLGAIRDKKNKITEKEISFALLNTTDGTITEKRAWINVAEANRASGKTLNLRQDGTLPKIHNEVWNSFNSAYSVSPNNYIVIANKYLMPTQYIFDPAEKSKSDVSEIIYVPYSRYVHTPETVFAGIKYLQEKIEKARQSLKAVPSRYDSSKSVADIVSERFPYYITLIEHIDPDSFLNASENQKKLLAERVLVRYGLNKDHAYKYTGSPAGAWGSAQFTKGTYNSMRKLYPAAYLISDFKLGVIDDVNSFKAMLVLFDHLKWDFRHLVNQYNVPEIMLEEMVASGYNGNPVRVARSFTQFGLAWVESQLNVKYTRLLASETKKYILKLRELRSIPIFGNS